MAKKSVVERQKKRLMIIKKYSLLRKYLKGKIYFSSNFDEKIYYRGELQNLPKDSSFIRFKNRCLLTGRSKGYYRFFGLCRHSLRELAHKGMLPGIIKASW
uniref:Small ribosomal subunit protein uS14c n=1 Tax=Trachelomonas grandis TaxID=215769 RepID=A0A385UK56_9EUGL|nr:ribosomal protein S14 [Trachelomonas grandis]